MTGDSLVLAEGYVDLIGGIGTTKLPPVVVSGDDAKVTVPVTVTNDGIAPVGAGQAADAQFFARPPGSPHDLRRSFSTIAQRAGVDKYTIQDPGGWSVVSVVEKHYTGEAMEVYRRAMDRIAGSA